jgi:two-component system copper resistance phosphate regulon response regulator CusR/two-component system response regulator QseB
MKVLIVEDERRLGAFLRQGLSEQAYSVTLATTCAEASDALVETRFDAVVLDLGLPDGDGLDLIREWRLSGLNEPILILSARDQLEDRIRGLDHGADDYLPKPFSLEELNARLRALLRRQSVTKQTVLERNGIRLDLLSHTVHFQGEPIDLTAREYALLEIFMQNGGRVLTRTFISEKIWASHYDVDTNLLDVYMSRLRGKFEHGGKPVFKTVRGIGYQLV